MTTFRKTVEGTTLTIAPEVSVNAINASEFHDVVNESLAEVTTVVFDFASMEFISSAGLRALVKLMKRCASCSPPKRHSESQAPCMCAMRFPMSWKSLP